MANTVTLELNSQPEMPKLSDEAHRLQQEHSELQARLQELDNRLYLTPQEEFERKTIQKLKLQKKDQIAALTVSYAGNS